MGGGHHDFGERMKIPDYRIYKIEDVPELVELRNNLQRKGLKDPWLRNEVWRYNKKEWGASNLSRANAFFFRGFSYGLVAFIATVALETAVKFASKNDGGHKDH